MKKCDLFLMCFKYYIHFFVVVVIYCSILDYEVVFFLLGNKNIFLKFKFPNSLSYISSTIWLELVPSLFLKMKK